MAFGLVQMTNVMRQTFSGKVGERLTIQVSYALITSVHNCK